MKKLNLEDLTPEMLEEIKACGSTEELKKYFESKNFSVSDEKLGELKEMLSTYSELDAETLSNISGGGCCWDDCGDVCESHEISYIH